MNQLELLFHVPIEFIDKFPELTTEKQELYYNKYLDVMRKYLVKGSLFTNNSFIFISLSNIFDDCGTFQYKNTRYSVYNEFKKLRPFYVETQNKGTIFKKVKHNFEKNSEVFIVNQKMIDFLIDTSKTQDLINFYYKDLTENTEVHYLPVDIDSLNNYINDTLNEIEKTHKNSELEGKMYRNLRQAKYIKLISEFMNDEGHDYVLPQIVVRSPYGRIYYQGINVQNISKTVRSAVLGTHYVYDLNAAVYSIKLMICKHILKEYDIDFFGQFVYTKEYLDFKENTRIKLCQHIKAYPNPIKLVKDALTSIGFGARISGGGWLNVEGNYEHPAITDIIKNKKDRENFINDPWVKNFVLEQQQMTKIIVEYYKQDSVWVESVKNIPKMYKNNRIRPTQVMSYVFQQAETTIMNEITKDIDVVARIHDSFITTIPITNEDLINIKYKLNQFNEFMTIDKEVVNGWVNKDIIETEREHKRLIKEQENIARQRALDMGLVTTTRYVKNVSYDKVENGTYYGYDDGTKHNEYDYDNDTLKDELEGVELQKHLELMGHNEQPEYIKRLLN
jgi:hypothetical protein